MAPLAPEKVRQALQSEEAASLGIINLHDRVSEQVERSWTRTQGRNRLIGGIPPVRTPDEETWESLPRITKRLWGLHAAASVLGRSKRRASKRVLIDKLREEHPLAGHDLDWLRSANVHMRDIAAMTGARNVRVQGVWTEDDVVGDLAACVVEFEEAPTFGAGGTVEAWGRDDARMLALSYSGFTKRVDQSDASRLFHRVTEELRDGGAPDEMCQLMDERTREYNKLHDGRKLARTERASQLPRLLEGLVGQHEPPSHDGIVVILGTLMVLDGQPAWTFLHGGVNGTNDLHCNHIWAPFQKLADANGCQLMRREDGMVHVEVKRLASEFDKAPDETDVLVVWEDDRALRRSEGRRFPRLIFDLQAYLNEPDTTRRYNLALGAASRSITNRTA